MLISKRKIGNTGEEIACDYLRSLGYKIIERNFTIRGGEADIIAKDKDVLVYIEVKFRSNKLFGSAKESINSYKISSLRKCAQVYNQICGWVNKPYRFDLIAIDFDKDTPKIELIENIFEG